jgi:hypothetical protein
MAKTPYIEDARLRHLLKVSAISGESRERNVALLMVIYGTGMMHRGRAPAGFRIPQRRRDFA